jgi:putative ribosome biogenesis GTPase RsgA
MVKDPREELKHHADERYFMHHKVVLLGDSGVGKSSLFANFIKEL